MGIFIIEENLQDASLLPLEFSYSRTGHKLPNFFRIFFAGRGFYAGDYVDAPGMERGDGFGYVFRGEAAGRDEVLAHFCVLEEGIGGEGPVEGLASAAGGGCGARVDEDGVDVGVAKACLRG